MENIIAVVGSRGFNDYPFFARKIKEITKDLENYSFISGGAKSGADNLIVEYCKENKYNLLEILPNWALYGKSAGVIRNSEIVNSATHLIAFWDGKSKGTKDSIRRAEIKGIPIRIVEI